MKFLGQLVATVIGSAAVVVGIHLGNDLYMKYKENKSKKWYYMVVYTTM